MDVASELAGRKQGHQGSDPGAFVESGLRRPAPIGQLRGAQRSEEHTSELQSLRHLVCRLLLEKKMSSRTPSTAGAVSHTASVPNKRPWATSFLVIIKDFFFLSIGEPTAFSSFPPRYLSRS